MLYGDKRSGLMTLGRNTIDSETALYALSGEAVWQWFIRNFNAWRPLSRGKSAEISWRKAESSFNSLDAWGWHYHRARLYESYLEAISVCIHSGQAANVEVSSEDISWKLWSLEVSVKHWIIARTGCSCPGRMWRSPLCTAVMLCDVVSSVVVS